jgi:hypothetical protein
MLAHNISYNCVHTTSDGLAHAAKLKKMYFCLLKEKFIPPPMEISSLCWRVTAEIGGLKRGIKADLDWSTATRVIWSGLSCASWISML